MRYSDRSQDRQRARKRAELLTPRLRHQRRLADADGEFAVDAQRRRDVEHHAGAQKGLDTFVEAQHLPLAPVWRERDAARVAGALAEGVGIAVTIDDGLAGAVHVLAAVAGLEGAERGVQSSEASVHHALGLVRWLAEPR